MTLFFNEKIGFSTYLTLAISCINGSPGRSVKLGKSITWSVFTQTLHS